MMIGVWGWDTANTKWVKVLVDSLGHVQIDVLSSALPTGAATLAKQSDQLTKLNSIITKLAGGLPAALDALALKVREQGTPEQHLFGYDGANWQTLLVESAAQKNLRVSLYDGTIQLILGPFNSDGITGSVNKLGTASHLRAFNGATWDRLRVQSSVEKNLRVALYDGADRVEIATWNTDAITGVFLKLGTASHLQAFNGATWDRLRSYPTGILKVGRAEVGLLTVRKTATGQVGATGARKLYWVHENPSAGSGLYELSDATSAGQTVVFDHFSTNREGHMVKFDPPMEFNNGIYLETYTNLTSLVIGYL